MLCPLVREWTTRHRAIDINVLLTYFSSALLDLGKTFFKQTVAIPTWKAINEADKTLAWASILHKPENLLNEQFVNGQLAKMEVKKQVRVIKALNKLSKKYHNLIPRREVPRVDRQPMVRKNVRIKDCMVLIQTLLATRLRGAVHFALDFYLILLSGQRYLKDFEHMRKGIVEMQTINSSRPDDDLELTYRTRITKIGGVVH